MKRWKVLAALLLSGCTAWTSFARAEAEEVARVDGGASAPRATAAPPVRGPEKVLAKSPKRAAGKKRGLGADQKGAARETSAKPCEAVKPCPIE